MDNKNVLTQEEIDDRIRQVKGIWGIEGMGMTEEEEKKHRDYLAGKITKEEYESSFLGGKNK